MNFVRIVHEHVRVSILLLHSHQSQLHRFPTMWYTKGFVEKSGIPTPENWTETWSTEIKNNYVSLDVVCETTQIETYTEDVSITAVDVVSNVGGHTGLWIGISFLSLMELVEMLYRLIRYHCYVYILKRRLRNETTINERL